MNRLFAIILGCCCAVVLARGEEPADPAQQEQRANDAWGKLSLGEKRRLLHLNRAMQQMPPEERKFIHERIEHFLTMTPAEREQLRQNRERWEKMTPEERDRARQAFRQRRKEFEEQWRREHPNGEPPPMRPHRLHESSEPQAQPKQENP